ncbi:BON domain-containing protein [Picosynechococcus sp. NKBG15041c]|uniref:BON domain-containing protein n=1 Tax=Picosynechococcus sp. NKBG15041c TaxID=1407650 RepID=UPI000465943B|nr:BON domain-containing protein [Picosynechococcus sp. NKBG15041c]
MNNKDITGAERIVHGEYQDSLGHTHTEYKDAQGNIYTEYIDEYGKIHTYKNSYANGHFAAEIRQTERESRAESNGLRIGILASCTGLVIIGTIYAVTRPEEIEPLPPVVNVEMPTPEEDLTEDTAEPPSVTTIVPINNQPATQPAPQQQPAAQEPAEPSNVNVTVTNPQSPPPAATPTTTPQTTPGVTDSTLRADITEKLRDSLPDNQLRMTVNNGEVTVTGTVSSQDQLQQIPSLLNTINGVKKVTNNATIAP